MGAHKEKGFTLLEIMLVLAGIAAVSAGGFYVAQRNNAQAKTQDAVQTARTLSTVLGQSWGQSGSFAGIDSQAVAQQAPQVSVKNNKLVNAWGGPIDFAPSPDGTAYSMVFGGVPSSGCVGLSTQLARAFASVSVNNTALASADPVSAAKLCGASDRNTVTLTSFPVAPPDNGEVPLPADHGAAPKLPKVAPPTLGAQLVQPVSPVSSLSPVALALPQKLNGPVVSAATAGAVSSAPVAGGAPSIGNIPPGVALPPQSCFPSVTSTPVVSTVYNTQTVACQAGYAGSITQQQSAQQTVTTTKTTTCATKWSAPQTVTTTKTDTGAYGAWSDVGNTCAPMCSTQLASYPAQANYQWANVSVGCPSGYTGQNTYQVLQVQTRSASCASPTSTAAPVYSGWSGWSNTGTTQNAVNTCAPAVVAPPVPQIAFSMWGVQVDVSPSPTATAYQIGISCGIQLNGVVPNPATVQTVPNSGLTQSPSTSFDTFQPALRIGGIGANLVGGSQVAAMTQALPITSCQMGGGFGGTWPVQVQARACNGNSCSDWSASVNQFCSFNKC